MRFMIHGLTQQQRDSLEASSEKTVFSTHTRENADQQFEFFSENSRRVLRISSAEEYWNYLVNNLRAQYRNTPELLLENEDGSISEQTIEYYIEMDSIVDLMMLLEQVGSINISRDSVIQIISREDMEDFDEDE